MDKLKKSSRIGAIHAACKKLGIDTDTRHAMQSKLVGKASLAAMSVRELDTVLTHLNKQTGLAAPYPGRPAACDTDPQLQKIEALLADQKLPWAYIHKSARGPSMVRRLTGKDRIEWADSTGRQAVITALVKRQEKQRSAT